MGTKGRKGTKDAKGGWVSGRQGSRGHRRSGLRWGATPGEESECSMVGIRGFGHLGFGYCFFPSAPSFHVGIHPPCSQLCGLDGASPQLQDGTLGFGLWQVVHFPAWVTLVGAEGDTHAKTVRQ